MNASCQMLLSLPRQKVSIWPGPQEIEASAGPSSSSVKVLAVLPPGVVTVRLPVVAPDGTDVMICVDVSLATVPATPLNATWVAPSRLDPEIVTCVPTAAAD